MAKAETEAHRELKRLALGWAQASGFSIAACEVRVPKCGYRADVAAYAPLRRDQAARTAVFECKQARADLLKDARDEREARRKVEELAERVKKLEELIGEHRPDLRKGETLFAEFDAWDFSGVEHATHRRVLAQLGTLGLDDLAAGKHDVLPLVVDLDDLELVDVADVFVEILRRDDVDLGLDVTRELAIDHPAVDLRVLRHRSLAAGSVYSMVLGMGLYGVMFAVPIFVQDYLHFTATQSGLLLMPGAFASAVAMIVVGKISGRFDPRTLIAIGALLTVSTAVLLARINPDTGTESLFFPLLLRGLGSVMMFIPLSLATIGNLPKRDISAGSGFYSLMRQMGSSIGIAIITTVLAHREAVHRSVLVERITAYSPETASRLHVLTGALAQRTGDTVTAKHQALGVLDSIVNGQALLLSFADVFRYVAVAFVATLPLLLLLGKGGNREAAAAAH